MSATESRSRVRLGIDMLLDEVNRIPGRRWGLLTNYTGVTSNLESSAMALKKAGAPLVAALTPEHGLRGTAQAGESEKGGIDPYLGIPVLDTYRLEGQTLDEKIRELKLDALLCDLQDIGTRYYTYSWSAVDCMHSAARLGIPFYVLDRPNPLGGVQVAGPGVSPGFSSFVGRIDVPIRHGMTIGELARVGAALARDAGEDVPDPTVIRMAGWRREMLWEDTGLQWVMPSPNIPTPLSAFAFCGNALFEGTNMSEGRGTTRPFEIIGAPWLDESFAKQLNELGLPGVSFRECWFKPVFSKHENVAIGGAQFHIFAESAYEPLTSAIYALHMAISQSDGAFQWREPAWEQGVARPHFIDLLWGSPSLRHTLAKGEIEPVLDQLSTPTKTLERDRAYLLY